MCTSEYLYNFNIIMNFILLLNPPDPIKHDHILKWKKKEMLCSLLQQSQITVRESI